MHQADQPGKGADADLPVLTEVAIAGDVARERGLYFEPEQPVASGDDGPDAEAYLADRLKKAVRESLSEAMVRSARGPGRSRHHNPDTDGPTRR